jgi:cell pole-organizing protein PopZ
MQTPREPSMEDILASIKRVIAEEKELRAAIPPSSPEADAEEADDVLELDSSMAEEFTAQEEPFDLGPPLLDDEAATETAASLAQLSTVAATAPPPAAINPLEDMLKDMLRPVLKQWLDEHLPRIVDEHVKREISRITGKPL